MTNRFFISDPHFGHTNICKFTDREGKQLRPFSTAEEMDETLIQNWNNKVNPNDRVYVLGDIAMKKVHISTISRCNGKKILIPGNHDIFEAKEYLKYFEDIRGVCVLPSRIGILSHIPLHPDSVERFRVNIHGHLHSNTIPDHKYFSVCVEQINYTPIHYDEILAKLNLDKLK